MNSSKRNLPLIALAAALFTATAEAQEAPQPVQPLWAFEESDIPVDPAFHFGVLSNGMRYILRENATPEGTALVRLHIGSGSLDENDNERGLAHFLEHMAFNGSTNVPEGEMIKLLEREGLAFGADTNASTGFETTVYKLNLPRNDLDLLDIALMLMRETASELLIEQDAVDRERGVILSERRDRRNYAYRETEDQLEFTSPGARYINRLPIGTLDVLENATAQDIRAFYGRTYVPSNAVLVVIGDLPIAEVERRIQNQFGDWSAGDAPADPETGPINLLREDETDIYLDPALSERVTITRFTRWEDRPDTIANRQQNLLRQIGYAIINRRLQTLARTAEAPFKGAGYGTGDMFEDGRATNLIIDTSDGEWRKGLESAAIELRRALAYGFSEAEVVEQVSRIRTSLENAASASATRSNSALVSAAISLLENEQIPSTPESSLARFNAFAVQLTPEAALAAVKQDAAVLDNPLIRFQGRHAPEGGADTLRAAWQEAASVDVTPPHLTDKIEFAYTDFGPAGKIISDAHDERFGFRLIRFENGVRLNLKQTDISEDRINFQLTLDGGQLLNTRENPLATGLISSIPRGGLGAHSQDELQTILAGRSVGFSIDALADAFSMSGTTTPRDLNLQMQLLAAGLTDPGYRQEGEEQFRRSLPDFFANLDSTPASALGNRIGEIISDSDPRFTLQSEEDYAALTFSQMKADIGDRLEHGAIEIALVGDFDEQTAIEAVASTLGALPTREPEFAKREDARQREFTHQRGIREISHSGEPDQALVYMVWPTRDDSDLKDTLELSLLSRVVQIRLQGQLREDLGKSYSPSAGSSPSRVWRDYGTFSLTASVAKEEVGATREAISSMLMSLLEEPVDQDTVDRARQPLLESYDNLLKSLGGWMTLADRAQSEDVRLERYFAAPNILRKVSADDLMRMANRYLQVDQAVEVLVLPKENE